jgi:hypothetical protein
MKKSAVARRIVGCAPSGGNLASRWLLQFFVSVEICALRMRVEAQSVLEFTGRLMCNIIEFTQVNVASRGNKKSI